MVNRDGVALQKSMSKNIHKPKVSTTSYPGGQEINTVHGMTLLVHIYLIKL